MVAIFFLKSVRVVFMVLMRQETVVFQKVSKLNLIMSGMWNVNAYLASRDVNATLQKRSMHNNWIGWGAIWCRQCQPVTNGGTKGFVDHDGTALKPVLGDRARHLAG